MSISRATRFARRLDGLRSGLSFIHRVVASRYNPLLAQIVVTRRCNLSCGYCNEYDDHSDPVPFLVLAARIDHLAKLNTAAVTLTGGEPLLHPELPEIVRAARKRKMIVTMITNGFRLSRERIEALNEAGLQGMQISIDNLKPDAISMKSLESVERKLELLAKYAEFRVNINSVLGISDDRTRDVVAVTETAARYGFFHSVGVLHDDRGAVKPLSPIQMAAYRRVTQISPSLVHGLNYRLFQKNLMQG
ncbi:MAG: radical SAM protein, partial [Steroidobacteraceae bacterium]